VRPSAYAGAYRILSGLRSPASAAPSAPIDGWPASPPSFFDSAVSERQRRQREARRGWLDQAELALRKIYGPSADPLPQVPEPLPLPPSRTRIAVERELECWRVWFGLGTYALQQSKLYLRHPQVNFNQLALLLKTRAISGGSPRAPCVAGCPPGSNTTDYCST
jgi:hypothetical protein